MTENRSIGRAALLRNINFHSTAQRSPKVQFTPGQLKTQWVALGEAPEQFDKLVPGVRLQAVALRQMV
ncbi:MAG: hypothetical protein WBC11_05955, partial [Dehalococcoidia bacterium]